MAAWRSWRILAWIFATLWGRRSLRLLPALRLERAALLLLQVSHVGLEALQSGDRDKTGGVPLHEITIAQIMKSAGYVTGATATGGACPRVRGQACDATGPR